MLAKAPACAAVAVLALTPIALSRSPGDLKPISSLGGGPSMVASTVLTVFSLIAGC
jgi:hypothetical protein